MVIGLAPPFALIVENAARIEREIAADRAHVAVGRAGDMGRGLRHDRIMFRHIGMRGDLGERDAAPISSPCASALMPRSSATPLMSISTGGATMPRRMFTIRSVPPPMSRLSRCDGAGGDQFAKRPRPDQIELRQRVHYEPPFCFAPLPFVRARFSSAANTRSGVTGRSLKRRPVASAMALVSAGRNAASEPSPASLAPNGPCGSMLSTMPTSIGGESWIVGTR